MLALCAHVFSPHCSYEGIAATCGLEATQTPSSSNAAPAGVQPGTQTKLTGWGQGLNWTEPMAQNFWTLAFLLGLMKMMLDFFHSRAELNPGQSFVFAPATINLTTKPHSRGGQGPHFHRQ